MAPRDAGDRLPWESYLDVVRTEVDRMLAVGGDLTAPVPSCPGWTVEDLFEHVALVFRHKVESMRTATEPPWPIAGVDTSDVRALLREESQTLLAELRQRGPREVRHTWFPDDRSNGFWFRRMAHEATMHRVDAELAYDLPLTHLDDAVALDGVDEFLTVLVGGPWWDDPEEETRFPVDAVVQIRSGEHVWTLAATRTAVTVTRGAVGEPELVVSGAPRDLYLWLWGRGSANELVLDGRKELVEELAGRFAEASA